MFGHAVRRDSGRHLCVRNLWCDKYFRIQRRFDRGVDDSHHATAATVRRRRPHSADVLWCRCRRGGGLRTAHPVRRVLASRSRRHARRRSSAAARSARYGHGAGFRWPTTRFGAYDVRPVGLRCGDLGGLHPSIREPRGDVRRRDATGGLGADRLPRPGVHGVRVRDADVGGPAHFAGAGELAVGHRAGVGRARRRRVRR